MALILLFFLCGPPPSPSSGWKRGILVDVLATCSSSESGRNNGWCPPPEVVGVVMECFGVDAEIGRFLSGEFLMMVRTFVELR